MNGVTFLSQDVIGTVDGYEPVFGIANPDGSLNRWALGGWYAKLLGWEVESADDESVVFSREGKPSLRVPYALVRSARIEVSQEELFGKGKAKK